jgi:hypothetical protein
MSENDASGHENAEHRTERGTSSEDPSGHTAGTGANEGQDAGVLEEVSRALTGSYDYELARDPATGLVHLRGEDTPADAHKDAVPVARQKNVTRTHGAATQAARAVAAWEQGDFDTAEQLAKLALSEDDDPGISLRVNLHGCGVIINGGWNASRIIVILCAAAPRAQPPADQYDRLAWLYMHIEKREPVPDYLYAPTNDPYLSAVESAMLAHDAHHRGWAVAARGHATRALTLSNKLPLPVAVECSRFITQ